MASTTITATVDGYDATLLVIYPYSDMILESELGVIRSWFIAFNSNIPDVSNLYPSSTRSYPAAVLTASIPLVSSPLEAQHITGLVSTSKAWGRSPRETNSCIHIYAIDHILAQGFHSRRIVSALKNKLSSDTIRMKVEAALDNNIGISD
ncbi:hypothetical protein CYLTODRAFT_458583 [Cylindrobasidium torrendii FP15055 ss-10]|uniref:Uncharacterized protein n=1 Tax=Cylindrobasidium torrendii FP15055 ss-10 TaxID=1314674 RepID=A0A0D7AX11_9AGAR|nr:hypothetical protein CYLTODRAFT_458583 [Cylindrobasidium torrendii FP15055 ss-10]